MAKQYIRTENRDALGLVTTRFNKSEGFFARYIRDTDRWYKLYRNEVSRPDNQYRSKVGLPIGFWTIETTVPRMVARPHMYSMTPRDVDQKQAVQYSVVAKQYFDYVLDQIDLKRKTRILAKDMKIFGSGFWKFGWDYESSMPFLENVPLRQLRVDPSVSDPGNIQKAKYVIYLTKVTPSELRNNPNYDLRGINLKALGTSTPAPTDISKTNRLGVRGLTNDIGDPIEQDIDLWEHWGWVDGERRLITVLNKEFVIRDEKAPYEYWPFEMAINTEDPDNILGIGDIEPVADLIDDMNTNRRMRTDNKNIRTNVMFLEERNAGILDEEKVWRPGGVIRTNVPKGLDPLIIPDTTQGSVEEELIGYQLVEKATNTPAQIQGQLAQTAPSASGLLNRTATAFRGSQQESNIRFKYQSEALDRCVEKTLNCLWKIIQINISGDQVSRIVGEDDSRAWMKIPEGVIKKEYIIDITFGSAALEDEQTKREEALIKLQALANIFPESAQFFLKDFLLAMGDKNVNDILQAVDAGRKKAAEMGQLPKPPQINLSIGGEDMNSRMVIDILKNYFQLTPLSTTPEMFGDTRMLMYGQTTEDLERDKVKIQLFEAITKAQLGEAKLSNEQMKIIADVFNQNEDRRAAQAGASEDGGMDGGERASSTEAGESPKATPQPE